MRHALAARPFCDTCCARLRSMPEYGHTAKPYAPLSPSSKAICGDFSLAPDVHSLGIGVCGSRLTKQRAPDTRLHAWMQETRSVTSDLGCHGSSSFGVCSRAGECVERRGQH